MTQKKVYDSIYDIIREFPPGDPKIVEKKFARGTCGAISEFMPPGLQNITKDTCLSVTGANKAHTYNQSSLISDSNVECVTQKEWFGAEQTYCEIKEGK